MTKPYTQAFKNKAVAHWKKINEKGLTVIKGIEIKNIRDLAKALGISKDSLYNWVNKMIGEEYDNIDDDNGLDLEFENAIDFENSKNELPGEKKVTPGVEFGTRFWQFVAKNMGIKNYAIPLKQLKLKIGTALINGTGLVESNKKVKNELRLD